MGCSPWGREESDMTERLHFHFSTFMHWRRKRQPTPVFLPGESQGRGRLVGCRLWGRTESDATEETQQCSLWYLSSLTRDRTQALGSESAQSSPLDRQAIPHLNFNREVKNWAF